MKPWSYIARHYLDIFGEVLFVFSHPCDVESLIFVLSEHARRETRLRPVLNVQCNFTWVKGLRTMLIEKAGRGQIFSRRDAIAKTGSFLARKVLSRGLCSKRGCDHGESQGFRDPRLPEC